MSINKDLIFEIKQKMLIKYPRFGEEFATLTIEYKKDLPCHTAATDGKKIYIDPDYFESLNDDDRLFLIAHEVMHIKFMHMYRLKDKSGKMRDLKIWNIATDAIINANLKRDGFKIKKGYVDIPDALEYTAEELYQKLLKEQEQQNQNGQDSSKKEDTQQEQDGSKNNESGQKEKKSQQQSELEESEVEGSQNEQDETPIQTDDHSMWEKAFEEKNDPYKKQESKSKESKEEYDEKIEFEENRKEKREKFEARKKSKLTGNKKSIKLGDVGETADTIDWRILVRKEIEKNELIWSNKRSIEENGYAYRLTEEDIEDDAITEVLIDISGSVDLDLVKAFLRQIKPLLKHSKLRVGCFNEKFWGFKEIRNEREINDFTIPSEARGEYAWTEDWDLAVRSFTKKREINKFIFTDGWPCPGTMPKEDLKRENVTWLVYGNPNFKPCCGKVINLSKRQIEKMFLVDSRDEIK